MIALNLNVLEEFDELLSELSIRVAPADERQAAIATEAYTRYGKGRHPAGLNFGDLFAYALAKLRDEPLLFKGDDFSKTDIKRLP
jgi:ribonuclease VapC